MQIDKDCALARLSKKKVDPVIVQSHQIQDAAEAKLILEEQLYLFPEWQRIAREVKDRCLKKKPWKK